MRAVRSGYTVYVSIFLWMSAGHRTIIPLIFRISTKSEVIKTLQDRQTLEDILLVLIIL